MTRDELKKIIESNCYFAIKGNVILDAVDAYTSALLKQCNVSGALPPADELMQLIEKQCTEHITIRGLRFYGTSWAQLVAIFEKFGYERKIPF